MIEPIFAVQGSLGVVLESLRKMWVDFLAHLPLLISGIGVLVVTWLVSLLVVRLLGQFLDKSKLRSSFKDLLNQLAKVIVWVAGITIAAVVVFPGMTPAKVLAGLGIFSVAVGFAFKDIVENFLAGILILWRFPFDPGDFIAWGEGQGKVEEITMRMTLVRKVDGELIVLPNAKLFKETVRVLTNRPIRRTTVICGVAYGEDVDASREVITEAVKRCSTVRQDQPVEIFAQEFASSSINFEVTWWSGATPLDVRKSRDEVVASVKRALDEANIEIPFPYRTLTFKEPLRTTREEANAS